MPVGARFEYITGRQRMKLVLLEDQEAVTDGTWLPLGGEYPFTVTVRGDFADTATVKILVSDEDNKPLDSDNDQAQLGSDVTAPQVFQVDFPYQWIKAQVSAYSGGTINVTAFSSQPITTTK